MIFNKAEETGEKGKAGPSQDPHAQAAQSPCKYPRDTGEKAQQRDEGIEGQGHSQFGAILSYVSTASKYPLSTKTFNYSP